MHEICDVLMNHTSFCKYIWEVESNHIFHIHEKNTIKITFFNTRKNVNNNKPHDALFFLVIVVTHNFKSVNIVTAHYGRLQLPLLMHKGGCSCHCLCVYRRLQLTLLMHIGG